MLLFCLDDTVDCVDVECFQSTKQLDDGSLRTLLANGRPEQRVWAAWEMALRVGSVVPHIVDHVGGEPTAGVRRALLVVLAGHGEIDVLVALGRHDPSPEVRAAAMQVATRFVAQGALQPSVVVEAYAGGDSQLRCSILSVIPAGAPDFLRSLVRDALVDGTSDEQLEAFEAALRDGLCPENRTAAMRWLAAAKAEVAADAWMRLQRLSPAEIVALVLDTNFSMRARALSTLTAVPIGELAALAVDGDSHTFKIIRDRHDFRLSPPDLLARAILSGCAVHYVETLAARLGVLVTAPESLAALIPRLRDHVHARLAAIAEDRYLPDEQPSWRWNARLHYNALLGGLDRLA